MIIANVFAQDLPQVPLVEDDHVVETLPAERGDVPRDVEFGLAAAPWPA